jgi:TolB-like protein
MAERTQRRLAAILAADVVSYSRLIEQDEAGTFERLRKHRKELFEPEIEKHHGRIFKLMGDGLLAEFGSAVDAVECAATLQRHMHVRNDNLADAERIDFRIGVSVGDVIVEGDDRHGDAVIVASRLQQLAEPGGVCISRPVFEHVKHKVALDFELGGDERLKNITEPMAVYRAQLYKVAPKAVPALTVPERPSIAVLPFQNLSGHPEQEYFADGIVEDITSGLARMHWLFVIARNSSFTYKGRAVDMKQIGRELGVRYLLEGSVRKAGERIRITTQLVDAARGAHIWSDRFDGMLSDIFDLQDRVTASVVGAIEPKLRSAEIERAREKPTESVDAYDLFLRALALHNTRKLEEGREALRLLYRAIEIDSRYASAYALAAYCVHRQRIHGWVPASDPMIAEGIRLARLAAEKGQDDPEALWMSGLVIANMAGDAEEGISLIERSLALNPNSANAWMASGNAYAYLGNTETAIAHLERSARLSPLDPLAYITWIGFGHAHFMAGYYEEASVWFDKTLHEAANHPNALRMKAACCGLLGRLAEGRKWAQQLLAVNPNASVSSLQMYYETVMKKPGCLQAFIDGLRKVGLPE